MDPDERASWLAGRAAIKQGLGLTDEEQRAKMRDYERSDRDAEDVRTRALDMRKGVGREVRPQSQPRERPRSMGQRGRG